ncbi:MAG: hypothetical protein AMK73_04640 [Planctomycetes bacterium SM23_32]|nr:MAG: hypothetical protein AMK73_04640 [Planctomycetes bacterium SM23_32]
MEHQTPASHRSRLRPVLRRPARLLALLLVARLAPCVLSEPDVLSWAGNFGSINLPALDTRDAVSTGSATETLILDGDAELSADNGAAARLTGPGGDVLSTEYQLTFDGDGGSDTGAATVDFTPYDSFLASPVLIAHVLGDDAVQVTLHVRAQNFAGQLANAGAYSATQTLTASWVGP